ncbi:MAG TPA: PaaI family thioesterase [Candidatus Hydrogenedentes bacterium]|nr:PaaI family thioesterase [Candidatus Hydrogenedentota bacterium]HPG66587.1 PaaI family thioesterase [Candidatus Hydrogenedentota bacterium]
MDPESDGKKYLPNSKECFVCGEENAAGLQTRFYVERDIVKTPLNARVEHCGYANTVHGGVVAAALDECMCWAAARALKRCCVTAELTIRYLQRVSPTKPMTVCAEIERAHRRLAYVRGWIEGVDGEVYVRGEGSFAPLSVDQTLRVDDALLYRGGEERVFEDLRAR